MIFLFKSNGTHSLLYDQWRSLQGPWLSAPCCKWVPLTPGCSRLLPETRQYFPQSSGTLDCPNTSVRYYASVHPRGLVDSSSEVSRGVSRRLELRKRARGPDKEETRMCHLRTMKQIHYNRSFLSFFCLCVPTSHRGNHLIYEDMFYQDVNFHANQTYFHMKIFARGLDLKQRQKVSSEWSLPNG